MKSVIGKLPQITSQNGSASGSIIEKMKQSAPSTAARGIIRNFPQIPASEQIIQKMNSGTGNRFRINPGGNNTMRVRFLANDPELTDAAQKARAIEFDRVSSALHSCMRQSGFGAHARALTELADFIKGRIRASPVRGEYSFEVETSIYQNGAALPGFDKISSHALCIKGPGVDLKIYIAFNKSVPCYIFCTPEKAGDLKQTSGAINAICDIIGTIKAQPKE